MTFFLLNFLSKFIDMYRMDIALFMILLVFEMLKAKAHFLKKLAFVTSKCLAQDAYRNVQAQEKPFKIQKLLCAQLFLLSLMFYKFILVSELYQLPYNLLQNILKKLRRLRKSCNHRRNINRIYNEKLHYNCFQQLPTLRLRVLQN